MKVMLIDFDSNNDEPRNIGLTLGSGQFQSNFTFRSDLLSNVYSRVAAGMAISSREWNFAFANYSSILTNLVDFVFIDIDDPLNPKLITIDEIPPTNSTNSTDAAPPSDTNSTSTPIQYIQITIPKMSKFVVDSSSTPVSNSNSTLNSTVNNST